MYFRRRWSKAHLPYIILFFVSFSFESSIYIRNTDTTINTIETQVPPHACLVLNFIGFCYIFSYIRSLRICAPRASGLMRIRIRILNYYYANYCSREYCIACAHLVGFVRIPRHQWHMFTFFVFIRHQENSFNIIIN